MGTLRIGILLAAFLLGACAQEEKAPAPSTAGQPAETASPQETATAVQPAPAAVLGGGGKRRVPPCSTPTNWKETVTIVHHANGGGSLEDCGCSTKPLGGLAKSSVASRRGKLGTFFLFDAGFPDGRKPGRPGGAKHEAVAARAKLLIKAYSDLGYSAYVPGDRDLLLGLPFLQQLAADASFPFLAANVLTEEGKLAFRTDVPVLNVKGARVALIGLISNTTPNALALRTAGFKIEDPYTTLKPCWYPPGKSRPSMGHWASQARGSGDRSRGVSPGETGSWRAGYHESGPLDVGRWERNSSGE